jgi:hypothetical protein
MGFIEQDVDPWPRGRIPYVLDNGHPFKGKIEEAIREINRNTNVEFVQRHGEGAYVEFICDGNFQNYAPVGYCGERRHEVNIKHANRILHELGHVVGMSHEHQRADRDQHIRLIRENFRDFHAKNTQHSIVETKSLSGGIYTEYDKYSCMHYWWCAHSKATNNPFLRLIDPQVEFWGGDMPTIFFLSNPNERHSTPETLSYWDKECINRFYHRIQIKA